MDVMIEALASYLLVPSSSLWSVNFVISGTYILWFCISYLHGENLICHMFLLNLQIDILDIFKTSKQAVRLSMGARIWYKLK